jgi:spermidine synthase
VKARILLLPILASALSAADAGDYVERFDTIYNSLTVERRGTIVELRARSRAGDFRESAVDLADPLRLVVPYTRTLFGGLFFKSDPEKVLMVGLGGAGFHRLFAAAYPDVVLHTVELDPKVNELTQSRLYFRPTENTPVTIMDGRQFVKRTTETWDWIILDAYRGGYVPPHLKTEEFYREILAKLSDDGVLITNLHATTELWYSDLRTLSSIFGQVVLFRTTANPGNVIAFAVKYRTPDITNPASWPDTAVLNAPLQGRLDMADIRRERIEWPAAQAARGRILTDDFSPVEFLDAMKRGNTTE